MATLTGQSIDTSYQGLLKTTDNGAITATAKALTDGLGNATNIEISNTATNFVSGTVDFTGSTVSGLPGGAAGLVNGTGVSGVNSIKVADALLTNNATASAGGGIAIGDNANSGGADNFQRNNIAIGTDAQATDEQCTAIGYNSRATGSRTFAGGLSALASGSSAVAIGNGAQSTNANTVAVGPGAIADQTGGVAIGHQAGYLTGTGNNSVSIGKFSGFSNGNTATMVGYSATGKAEHSVCLGYNARVESTGSTGMIAIGQAANSVATSDAGPGAIVIGQNAQIDGTGGTVTITNGIALGKDSIVSAAGAVAIGGGVTASTADTVSMKALEMQTNSTPTAGGIIMSDAGGTDRRLNVTSEGNLQLGTEIVGIVGWSTTKVSENQAASSCDTTRASVKIPAGTVKAGDILQIKSLEQRSGSTGFTYSNLAIHTAGTIGQSQAGAFVSGFQSSSDGFGAHSKTLFVQTVDGTGDGTQYLEDNYNPQEQAGGIFSSNLGSNTAIDWTVDQYLCVNVCIDNSGATWTNYGAALTIIGRN